MLARWATSFIALVGSETIGVDQTKYEYESAVEIHVPGAEFCVG